METLYKYAFGDEGKEAALNTYLNMSEKRRKSKTNKDKRAYNSRTEKEENLHYECDSICFDCCGSFDLVFWN